ncbi:hypothetical protein [Pseudomonas sp. CCNWLW23]|uniref:hypothetical protein n=1 Tax=Pseudomonas sp. CCNWLW23 TaxID=3126385 RepID=UPI003012B561
MHLHLQHLVANAAGCRFDEDAAVRALFCVMYPDRVSDEDFVQESFQWFFEMINRIGGFSPAFEKLAAKVALKGGE